MLGNFIKTPEKSPSVQHDRPDDHEWDQSGNGTSTLPSHVAGSGALDRLVEIARDYARAAVSENTRKAYATDGAAFAR